MIPYIVFSNNISYTFVLNRMDRDRSLLFSSFSTFLLILWTLFLCPYQQSTEQEIWGITWHHIISIISVNMHSLVAGIHVFIHAYIVLSSSTSASSFSSSTCVFDGICMIADPIRMERSISATPKSPAIFCPFGLKNE
jgi:hypothetical protein